MRVLLQRVLEAGVRVDGTTIGEIKRGLLLFVGVEAEDTNSDVDYLVKKVSQLRIFPNEAGKLHFSVIDLKLDVMIVSQFTLYADCHKGRRPDFSKASAPDHARIMIDDFIRCMGETEVRQVATGRFGADMKVHLVNDGPVTLMLESP